MCSLACLRHFIDVSLPKMAIQYVTSGKGHSTGSARMSRTIGMIVCVSSQGRSSFVGLVANIAFVHAVQC